MFDRTDRVYADPVPKATSHEEHTVRRAVADEHSDTGASGPASALVRLQRAVGNARTTRLIQAKLQVGAANDPLEHEADEVARQVVELHASDQEPDEPATISRATSPELPTVARATDEDAGDGVVGLEGGPAPAGAVEAMDRSGPGSPLPAGLQRTMEGAMGADLSQVRVHTGGASDTAARQLQARAFTAGADVHFAAGEYDPSSSAGQELIAHEVAHTVQQGDGASAQRRTIHRMPAPAAVKARTGKEEKKGKKIFGKRVGATSSYNALMDALRAHSAYTVNTPIALNPQGAAGQVTKLHALIDTVVTSAQRYLEKDDAEEAVADVCTEIVALAPLEKKVVTDLGNYWGRNPHGVALQAPEDLEFFAPKWFSQVPSDPRRYAWKTTGGKALDVTVKEGGKTAGGVVKTVQEVVTDDGTSGYFAEDDDGEAREDRMGSPRETLEDYGSVGAQVRLEERSIAMSRLDQLLKGGVIARTERALKGETLGTFQWEAQGKSMDAAIEASDDLEDPELARLLSRLQLIDIIAGQIDRHEGNYFVQRDVKNGKVVGITGIDLDLAWVTNDGKGKTFDIEKGARNAKGYRADPFPGFSRYVDKELAQTIIALEDDDLVAILDGLIPEDAIDAALERLHKLQELLQEIETQLLEPNEWTKHVLAKIVKERHDNEYDELGAKSYYGRTHAKVEKKRAFEKDNTTSEKDT